MKFLFNGHLFKFFRDRATIVTPYGDTYRLDFTEHPDIPFQIQLLKRRDFNEDIEQLKFELEMLSDD